MKKVLFLFIACLMTSTLTFAAAAKIKIKHAARNGQSCYPHKGGCESPLGICISSGVADYPAPSALTAREIADGWGTADVTIVNGKVKMVFNQPTALSLFTI